MWEYLEWLNRFEYLNMPSWPMTTFYLLLAGLFYLLRMYIFILFFWNKCFQEYKKAESVHGEQIDSNIVSKILGDFFAIIIGPVIEEVCFRGPILWFVQRTQYGYAIVALAVSSVIFAMLHLVESYGTYQDGTNIKKTKSAIQSTVLGGFFLGVLVLMTSSLWPAIFLHVIWNVSAIIIEEFYNEKFNIFAQTLQR